MTKYSVAITVDPYFCGAISVGDFRISYVLNDYYGKRANSNCRTKKAAAVSLIKEVLTQESTSVIFFADVADRKIGMICALADLLPKKFQFTIRGRKVTCTKHVSRKYVNVNSGNVVRDCIIRCRWGR